MRIARFPRLGCLGWVMAFIVFVTAAGAVGYLWYHSLGDVRQVENEARAVGIPPTWAEAGLVQSDPLTLAQMQSVVSLSTTIRSWTNNHSPSLPRLGEEAPQELRDYHGAIPALFWNELTEKITLLSVKPVVLYASPRQYFSGQSVNCWISLRDLCYLFTERMMIVPLAEVPSLVLTASQLTDIIAPQALVDQMMIDSMASIVAQGVTRRLPELRGTSAGHACAQHLRVLRDKLWNNRTQVWLAQMSMMSELPDDAFYYTAAGTWSYEFEELWKQAKGNCKQRLQPLGWRLQRADSMRAVLQYALVYQAATDPADFHRRISAVTYSPTAAQHIAAALDVNSNIEAYVWMDRVFLRTLLSLEVVIAELEGSPLPIDYFSPTGAALQPVIRSGKRIGWYSVDFNGTDGGGDQKNDFGFPTDETLGRPHFADELKARPEKKEVPSTTPVSPLPPGTPPAK